MGCPARRLRPEQSARYARRQPSGNRLPTLAIPWLCSPVSSTTTDHGAAPAPGKPATLADIASVCGGRRLHRLPRAREPGSRQRGHPHAHRAGRSRARLRRERPGQVTGLRTHRHDRDLRLRHHQPVLLRHHPRHAEAAEGGRLPSAAGRHRGVGRHRGRHGARAAPVVRRRDPVGVAALRPSAHRAVDRVPARRDQPADARVCRACSSTRPPASARRSSTWSRSGTGTSPTPPVPTRRGPTRAGGARSSPRASGTTCAWTRVGPFSPKRGAGAAAADAVLNSGATACVAFNDLLAIGILERLRDRGCARARRPLGGRLRRHLRRRLLRSAAHDADRADRAGREARRHRAAVATGCPGGGLRGPPSVRRRRCRRT